MIEAGSSPLTHGASDVPFAEATGSRSPRLAATQRSTMVQRRPRLVVAALVLGILSGTAQAAEKTTAGAVAPASAAADKPSTAVLANSRFDNGVVAVIDGDPITLRELKNYGITGAPFLPPDVRGDYRALLDSMIEHRLLKFEFEKNGIHPPDEMVERYIAGVLEESRQTRTALEADVAKAGISWKDYFERMREEVARIQLVNLLIRSRVNVSEEEVKRAWENDSEYLDSEKLVVAAIFVPSSLIGEAAEQGEQEALKVQKEAKSDFAGAARQYSKGPGASDGGELGEFQRGTMAPHFEKALQGLDDGEVSMPVPGPGGYYIVKLVDIKSSGRRPFEEVKEQLSEKIYENRLTERYKKWVTEDLRKDHRIDNLVDSLAVIAAGADAPPTPAQPARDAAVPAKTPEEAGGSDSKP